MSIKVKLVTILLLALGLYQLADLINVVWDYEYLHLIAGLLTGVLGVLVIKFKAPEMPQPPKPKPTPTPRGGSRVGRPLVSPTEPRREGVVPTPKSSRVGRPLVSPSDEDEGIEIFLEEVVEVIEPKYNNYVHSPESYEDSSTSSSSDDSSDD